MDPAVRLVYRAKSLNSWLLFRICIHWKQRSSSSRIQILLGSSFSLCFPWSFVSFSLPVFSFHTSSDSSQAAARQLSLPIFSVHPLSSRLLLTTETADNEPLVHRPRSLVPVITFAYFYFLPDFLYFSYFLINCEKKCLHLKLKFFFLCFWDFFCKNKQVSPRNICPLVQSPKTAAEALEQLVPQRPPLLLLISLGTLVIHVAPPQNCQPTFHFGGERWIWSLHNNACLLKWKQQRWDVHRLVSELTAVNSAKHTNHANWERFKLWTWTDETF